MSFDHLNAKAVFETGLKSSIVDKIVDELVGDAVKAFEKDLRERALEAAKEFSIDSIEHFRDQLQMTDQIVVRFQGGD